VACGPRLFRVTQPQKILAFSLEQYPNECNVLGCPILCAAFCTKGGIRKAHITAFLLLLQGACILLPMT
jgi:hypothetical protein